MDDRAPSDAAYVFSGYAPLTVRGSRRLLLWPPRWAPSRLPTAEGTACMWAAQALACVDPHALPLVQAAASLQRFNRHQATNVTGEQSLSLCSSVLERRETAHPACPAVAHIALCVQVRLVEGAVKGPGWGVPEEALRLLPGPAFEVEQATDDQGLPIERPWKPTGAHPGATRPAHLSPVLLKAHGSGAPWVCRCRVLTVARTPERVLWGGAPGMLDGLLQSPLCGSHVRRDLARQDRCRRSAWCRGAEGVAQGARPGGGGWWWWCSSAG